MNKEEKIKDVYEKLGFEWNVCKKYITDNGILILPTPDLKYSLKGYENLVKDENKFSAFGKEGLKLQPSELAGIYNNNGWIKIETQDDLPTNYTECHFELKDGDIQIGIYVDHKNIFIGADEQYFPSEVIAYKEIEKPKNRIY